MGFDVYERVLVCEETMPVGRERERERESCEYDCDRGGHLVGN